MALIAEQSVLWLDITNAVCNTIQVVALAWIGALVSGGIRNRRQ